MDHPRPFFIGMVVGGALLELVIGSRLLELVIGSPL
jgi:hypothetical protein